MSHNLLLEEFGPGEELPGFDTDDPVLPREIAAEALRSGGYPYGVRMSARGLVRDGIILIKLWLIVGREMQLKALPCPAYTGKDPSVAAARSSDRGFRPRVLCNSIERSSKPASSLKARTGLHCRNRRTT